MSELTGHMIIFEVLRGSVKNGFSRSNCGPVLDGASRYWTMGFLRLLVQPFQDHGDQFIVVGVWLLGFFETG